MKVYESLSDKDLIDALKAGQVGIIPTDTVYGLVALASNESSVNRIYNLKSRTNKPGTIIAANIDQLVELGIKRRYLKAVEQFWPGAVSVEIPFSGSYLNQGTGKIAIRIPADKNVTDLLGKTGALQTSSANPTGKKTSETIEEAKKYFGDAVDFYVDGGDLFDRPPSTIIRIVDDAIEIIRKGAVDIQE